MHNIFMYNCIMYNKEHLKGTLKTILLALFEEKGDMYGYEISQTVKLRSQGELVLTEGALYPALHKLESNKLLESYSKAYEGRTRKYYRITEKGIREASDARKSWKSFAGSVEAILNPINYA